VYRTFHSTEIQLDSIVHPEDWEDEWQVETALGTWKAMQQSESE
jgi:hypothetical protein